MIFFSLTDWQRKKEEKIAAGFIFHPCHSHKRILTLKFSGYFKSNHASSISHSHQPCSDYRAALPVLHSVSCGKLLLDFLYLNSTHDGRSSSVLGCAYAVFMCCGIIGLREIARPKKRQIWWQTLELSVLFIYSCVILNEGMGFIHEGELFWQVFVYAMVACV